MRARTKAEGAQDNAMDEPTNISVECMYPDRSAIVTMEIAYLRPAETVDCMVKAEIRPVPHRQRYGRIETIVARQNPRKTRAMVTSGLR